ncbi:tetraspanin 37 isoform X2 [Boleophthalmus pectinirostris]|uniref:tetraspanin 37 isoform X2 n=1 Tax=Boleophthalmus pectinirostris TaxID=150288 RepID=UPI00242D8C40|nr:tetraspanin 37 isoform X2 [Boleophthalmus pectinirostris]XP_055017999.1 tetraspanin 37 isoform X2 [Boleophthalmus pectinirostris]
MFHSMAMNASRDYQLVGMMVGLAGLYLFMMFRQSSATFFSPSSYMMLPFFFTFATAVFLLVGGFLGSWVSTKDSVCLQGLFVYLLFVVFCLGSTASALTFHHTVMLDSELDPLSDVFKNYTGNSYDQDSRTVDALQEKMQCCGVQNYTDWRDTSWFIHNGGHILPLSCCNQIFTSCNGTVLQPDHFYQTGCKVKLKVFFQFLLDTVMWMFAVVFLVLVILLVPTVMLMREPLLSYQYLDKS